MGIPKATVEGRIRKMKKKILVTGASGFVGGLVYRHFFADAKNYETSALDRTSQPSPRVPKGREIQFPRDRFFCEDLARSQQLEDILKGVEIIAHLAAEPRIDASRELVDRDNILATKRLYEAAAKAGVRKVILASTGFVMAGYGSEEPFKAIREGRKQKVSFFSKKLTHESPPKPLGVYAESKVVCENIARDYAERSMISSICLRIGAVTPDDTPSADPQWRPWWCSQRDLVGIFEKAVLCEGPRFDIFFGVSKNRSRWVDLRHAKKILGFVPRDGAP